MVFISIDGFLVFFQDLFEFFFEFFFGLIEVEALCLKNFVAVKKWMIEVEDQFLGGADFHFILFFEIRYFLEDLNFLFWK